MYVTTFTFYEYHWGVPEDRRLVSRGSYHVRSDDSERAEIFGTVRCFVCSGQWERVTFYFSFNLRGEWTTVVIQKSWF